MTRGGGRELATRVVVGVALAAVALWATWVGGWIFMCLVAFLALLGIVEWSRLFPQATLETFGAISLVIGAILITNLPHASKWAVAVVVIGSARNAPRDVYWLKIKSSPQIGYFGLCAIALVWLRAIADGFTWVAFTFAVVWSADIAAYAVGRTVGGPKLWLSISPNKTWAGFAGACVAACGAAVAVAQYLHVAPLRAGVAGLLFGALAQGGDLFESALKRRAGVKDSGTLLPGHGGVLDRIDSLIPVAPAVASAVALGWL